MDFFFECFVEIVSKNKKNCKNLCRILDLVVLVLWRSYIVINQECNFILSVSLLNAFGINLVLYCNICKHQNILNQNA